MKRNKHAIVDLEYIKFIKTFQIIIIIIIMENNYTKVGIIINFEHSLN